MENLENKKNNSNVCVCAICITEIKNHDKDYTIHTKKMMDSYLNYTNYDLVILTDNKKSFESYFENQRIRFFDYDFHFDQPKRISNFFNYHLKRLPIRISKELGYEFIYYVDCDTFIENWDSESFDKKCQEDFDVAFVGHATPALGDLRRVYPHFQTKIDLEFDGLFYEELDNAPNPAETHVLFKNNSKLDLFLEFWDKIYKNNKNNNPTYHDGVYFGTSAVYAKMKMTGINNSSKFVEYSRISHGGEVINFFGHRF